MGSDGGWRPYVSASRRRARALRDMMRAAQRGEPMQPLQVPGRAIARSFWGQAWCQCLEQHCDFANRLPRGRTYLRNGSLIDLRIEKGMIRAQVQGHGLYTVTIRIAPLSTERWMAMVHKCLGGVASFMDLLQGTLSEGVLKILTHPSEGLFPKVEEMQLDCSCPDWAAMCKHVAATLYGVGYRLDSQPELLFLLRSVDGQELVARTPSILTANVAEGTKVIEESVLSELFGVEIEGTQPPGAIREKDMAAKKKKAGKKKSTRKATAAKQQPAAKRGSGERAAAVKRAVDEVLSKPWSW